MRYESSQCAVLIANSSLLAPTRRFWHQGLIMSRPHSGLESKAGFFASLFPFRMYRKSFDGTLRANTLFHRIAAEELIGDSLSPDTVILYSRKIRQIALRASINNYQELTPEIIVRDLQERINSEKITQATARLEKSAALRYLADKGKMGMDSGSRDVWRFELAYRDISLMSVGALPKKSESTSSNKLKAFSDEAFDLLMGSAFNKKSDATRNLLLFIRANLLVGLRPVEWLNTCFINYQHRNALGELLILPDGSTKTSPALEVQNAKHSSIRGNGERRIILLDNLDDVKIQYIHQWIQAINKLKTDDLISLSETEINRKIYGSMQRVMRNLLMKNGSKENIPTIYSTRHQAVANARADGLSQKEIAALFGHSSTNTARRHYGKRTAGYSGRTMRPAPESLQAVRSTIAVRPKAAWAEASPGFG